MEQSFPTYGWAPLGAQTQFTRFGRRNWGGLLGDRMKEVQGTELYWHKLGGVPRVYANILPPLNSVLSERDHSTEPKTLTHVSQGQGSHPEGHLAFRV